MTKEPTSLPDTMLDDVPIRIEPRKTRNQPSAAYRDYKNQAENFHGARGSVDQTKVNAMLYGDTPTWEEFKKEKPVHVTMAAMAASGYTSEEIAQFTGYNVHHVCKVLRQPFARERMVGMAEKNSREEIKAFLEKETMPSLEVIRDLRDNPQVAPAVRGNMANLLVERFLGKAVQPIDPNAKPVSEMKDEDLKADVESILQQTRAN
jgi:hypothetical protein